MTYMVMVADNYHFMDEGERYRFGEFADAAVAIGHCRKIVDEYLESACEPGMSGDDLYESFKSFGEYPYIVASADSVDLPPAPFSVWDYAREKSDFLCGAHIGEFAPRISGGKP
jgi:hypothetical protein